MNKDAVELAELVLEWWEEHQYDTCGSWNKFDEEPLFVVKATLIKDKFHAAGDVYE